MLKQSILGFGALVLALAPAESQDAREISLAQSGQSCENCNLFQADLSFTQMKNISFAGARLRQSDLSLATMDGVNFADTNLSIANMFGGRFTGASFKNANLSQATLVGGYFHGADFTNANLSGANLAGAEMGRAKGLTQNQLSLACGDASTLLPSGLKVPHC